MATTSFDNDAEGMARLLSDAAAALHERDTVKRAGGNAADAGGKLRGLLLKADKQLEKISSVAKAAEASATSLCVLRRRHRRREPAVPRI